MYYLNNNFKFNHRKVNNYRNRERDREREYSFYIINQTFTSF